MSLMIEDGCSTSNVSSRSFGTLQSTMHLTVAGFRLVAGFKLFAPVPRSLGTK